jgi:hypothetical protein
LRAIFAVVELEDKQLVNMPKELLPAGAAEGSVIDIRIDEKETKERKERASKRLGSLWIE